MNFIRCGLIFFSVFIVISLSVYSAFFFQESFSQQGDEEFWSQGSPMPVSTTEVAATILHDTVYIIGGYDEEGEGIGMVEMYNITSDTWSSDIAQLPSPIHHASAASYQGKIYVIGGYIGDWTASDRLFIYDPETNKWTLGNPMPTPRAYPVADYVNGTLYVIGGDGGEGKERALSVVESYDPITNQWTSHEPMPTARHHAASAVVDGQIYVIGGRIGESLHNVDIVEKYDPATDKWTTDLEPMPSKRSGIGAASLNGYIYVLGGEQNQGTFDNNERYDPVNNTWTIAQPMPTPRHGLGVASYDDKIYAIGGGPERGFFISDINEIFQVGNETR